MKFNPTEYYRTSNENTAIILQLEGLEAVENVEEIVAVPAIDAIFVGPYDLSQSMGIPGQVQDAELRRKMKVHPDLVEYHELTEEGREKDRVNVRDALQACEGSTGRPDDPAPG